ncbi:MAG: GTPase HflX [Acidobacteria bacterium]|nr:GTPase HflX [Acidobacteriota bacterium]
MTTGRHDGEESEIGEQDSVGPIQDHRGAFGEFGGESDGLIERAFRERIVLVGLTVPPRTDEETEASLDELSLLVDTAGADEVARVVQRRDRPEPATFIGSGKVAEVKAIAEATDCDSVVFDDDLTPAQQHKLESILGRSALDRTAVILDIFAQNASTPEGRAQVELAQLQYRLPRLRGRGKVLSQQGAGIGTRGPGETQLEVDRRRLIRRMHKLEADLERISRRRATQSKRRRQAANLRIAIVGYTNSGKSMLLNRLTQAGVLVENRLFATLDATTRQLQLPGGEMVLLTDTVGFVRKLPHELVEAFKTTLDVVVDADLLVHLVDGSSPDVEGNIAAVCTVLDEIGAGDIEQFLVFNKSDIGSGATHGSTGRPGSVALSAKTGDGIDEFLEALSARLRSATGSYTLFVGHDRGDIVAQIHREGQVLDEQSSGEGTTVIARLADDSAERLAPWVTGSFESPDGTTR